MEYLCERTAQALRITNGVIQRSKKENVDASEIDDLDENASYLDMSMRKYESYNVTEASGNFNRNDYVDVIGKSSEECNEDDNIYDNFSVERNGKGSYSEKNDEMRDVKRNSDGKYDCPFNGLPAAHLTIMHSPKMGWLTMHLRRKRFIRNFGINFKRKYYTGLVSKQIERDYHEWWLLMYSGGTSDLKPTVCLPLNQFEVIWEFSKIKSNEKTMSSEKKTNDDKRMNEIKRMQCKFELNEKFKVKDPKSYCFVAETPEHCEHWINLLKQLSTGLPCVETIFTSTAQIRKLPMVPSNAKNAELNCMNEDIDTVDMLMSNGFSRDDQNIDLANYSEGVYEEPEEYYKNVPVSMSKVPTLPQKKMLPSTAVNVQRVNISAIYDTPKKPIRKTDDAKQYELVPTKKDASVGKKDSSTDVFTISSSSDVSNNGSSFDGVKKGSDVDVTEKGGIEVRTDGTEVRKEGTDVTKDGTAVKKDINIEIMKKDSSKDVARKDRNFEMKKEISITNEPVDVPLENRIKIDDDIRCKLSTQLKQQSQKYLSNLDRKSNDDVDMIKTASMVDGIANKYQLSTVRKWFFSNHLAKLRQSTNPTNFMRRSSGGSANVTPQIQPIQRHKTNAIAPSSDVQKRAFSVQPKGNKVHMIINQLEANGQLTLLSGGAPIK